MYKPPQYILLASLALFFLSIGSHADEAEFIRAVISADASGIEITYVDHDQGDGLTEDFEFHDDTESVIVTEVESDGDMDCTLPENARAST